MDDAELVRDWQRGGARAFEALVRRWQQPVARFLGQLVEPGSLPDLCQEVFLRVFQAAGRYRDQGHFATWLFRIALNVARDHGRRQRPRPLTLTHEPAPGRAPPPDAVCERRELVERVAGAVAELPEPLRLVLVLHHYEGLAFAEIARLLQTPESTLKSRFSAALHRLRGRLRPWQPTSEEITP
jgi:RNA polymerase sigma-70 factor (ECF subfamily)